MSPLATEIIGNLLALWCIVLIARNSVWNWPVGIANCVFYIILFYPAKLYGDCILQGVYIVLSLLGIYQWLYGRGGYSNHQAGIDTQRPISRGPLEETGIAIVVLIAAGLLFGWGLHGITDTDVPYWDGMTTAGCLIATWLQAYRRIDHWWVWITTNVSYFFLYQHKGLHITQWCQIIFLAASVVGYIQWNRELRALSQARTEPAPVTA